MRRAIAAIVLALGTHALAQAQVAGTVSVRHMNTAETDNSGVVLWLTSSAALPPAATGLFRMAQKDKQFEPHLLVVPAGSTVEFPNLDPFFHDVFSLGDGPPFDLQLYEGGGSRSRTFTKPAVIHVFCNIHPSMSAVIVVVDSRWYTISGPSGTWSLDRVPAGSYRLHVWYERATADTLETLARNVAVGGETHLPPISVIEANLPTAHKNKYGQDYGVALPYGGRGDR